MVPNVKFPGVAIKSWRPTSRPGDLKVDPTRRGTRAFRCRSLLQPIAEVAVVASPSAEVAGRITLRAMVEDFDSVTCVSPPSGGDWTAIHAWLVDCLSHHPPFGHPPRAGRRGGEPEACGRGVVLVTADTFRPRTSPSRRAGTDDDRMATVGADEGGSSDCGSPRRGSLLARQVRQHGRFVGRDDLNGDLTAVRTDHGFTLIVECRATRRVIRRPESLARQVRGQGPGLRDGLPQGAVKVKAAAITVGPVRLGGKTGRSRVRSRSLVP